MKKDWGRERTAKTLTTSKSVGWFDGGRQPKLNYSSSRKKSSPIHLRSFTNAHNIGNLPISDSKSRKASDNGSDELGGEERARRDLAVVTSVDGEKELELRDCFEARDG